MRNSNLKRTLSAILVMALLCLSLPVLARTYDDAYQKEIDAVTGLGIMDGENSRQFFPEDQLDRAEMVRMIMKLRNSHTGDRRQRFSDVRLDYYAFAEIDEAVNLGYITVGEDRLFHPEDPASAEEALRMMLYLLNYKTYLQKGKMDVFSLAGQVGLTDGVRFSGTGITKAELAKVIYNSFSCNMLEMRGISGVNMVIEEGEKTGLYYLGLQMIKGTVMANDCSSVYYTGTPEANGKIRIDDTVYYEGASYAGDLLGYSVEAFCTDTDSEPETVVYAVPGSKNKILTIECENVDSVEALRLRYGNGKSVSLKKDMCLIYNGTAVEFNEELFKSLYGTITFINTDGKSSGYNVAKIDSYESFSVSAVSSVDEKINFKNGMIGGKQFLETEDTPDRVLNIFEDGERTDLSAITADSVISVFYSKGNKEIITIYVSKKRFTAVMTGKGGTNDRGEETVRFDDESYTIGKNMVGAEKLIMGESFTLSVDYKGYLIEAVAGGSVKNYAALLRVAMDESGDICYLKLLNQDGKIATYQTKEDKVRYVEGTTKLKIAPSALYQNLQGMEYSLILVDFDADQKVKSVTVPVAYDKKNPLSNEGIFTLYKKVEASTMASYGMIAGVGCGNAINFVIPPAVDGVVDVDSSKVIKGTYFGAGSSYSGFQLYDVGIEALAGATVIRDKAGSGLSGYDIGIFVVSKKSETINADDQPVTQLVGWQNGVETKLTISNDPRDLKHAFAYDIQKAEAGDIFLYATNTDGEISAYSYLYADAQDKNSFRQLSSIGNGFSTTRECSTYHAHVQYIGNGYCTIYYGEETVPATTGATNSILVYRVNRSTKKVTKGEWGDIKAKNFYTGQDGSEVVVRTNRNGVVEVVVYED